MPAHLSVPVQSPSATDALSAQELTSVAPAKDRFDLMFGRMRGTMTILSDIVGPDPEIWTCERE